jgi:DNA-binding NarL/FixJ family response regulator
MYAREPAPLTPRMRQVLRCAAAGRSARGTARELGVSEATVWSIRTALCVRLGVSTMPAAIATAMHTWRDVIPGDRTAQERLEL